MKMQTKLKTQQQEEYKQTELGLLPKEWKVVKLGNENYFQILKSGIDKFTKTKEYLSTSSIEGNNIVAIEEEITYKNRPSRANMQPILNSVWFARMRNTKKVYAFTEQNKREIERYILSTGFLGVKTKSNCYSDFLKYYFMWDYFNNQKDSLCTGAVQVSLNTTNAKKLLIILPPLPEQKAIAFVLSTIQTAKEKTEKVIQATKELKKSLMKHLFTYGPVSLKDAEKVKLKETEIGKIPEGWEVVKVKDVFEFSKKPRDLEIKDDDEIPFIPMELIPEANKSAKWQLKRYSEILSGTFVFKNDLIVAKITPCFENGKQAILSNLPTKYAYATTEVWALHPKNEKVINEHLYEILKIPEVRINLAGKMEGTTGRQRLPKHVLANLKIPLPPLQTQKKIASILSAVDEKIEKEENKKKALEELFKSMLHNLMTAKIRVKDLGVENES